MTGKLGIITGMVFEANVLRRAARSMPAPARPAIVCLGMGGAAAERGAQNAIDQGATALLSFGIAAGLDPALQPGDVIVASAVHSAGRAVACDHDWTERLYACLANQSSVGRVLAVAIAHAANVLATPADKAALRASSGGAIADMESFAVAEIAAHHKVAFAALRVVADRADDYVPAIALRAARPDGHIDTLGSILGALTHPVQIPGLVRLGQRTAIARRTMACLADLGLARSFFA